MSRVVAVDMNNALFFDDSSDHKNVHYLLASVVLPFVATTDTGAKKRVRRKGSFRTLLTRSVKRSRPSTATSSALLPSRASATHPRAYVGNLEGEAAVHRFVEQLGARVIVGDVIFRCVDPGARQHFVLVNVLRFSAPHVLMLSLWMVLVISAVPPVPRVERSLYANVPPLLPEEKRKTDRIIVSFQVFPDIRVYVMATSINM